LIFSGQSLRVDWPKPSTMPVYALWYSSLPARVPKRPTRMSWAALGEVRNSFTAPTWLRFSSPVTLLASSRRWPSWVTGMGTPARMPKSSGAMACSGITRVCAGPGGRAMLARRPGAPATPSISTSRVMAQSIAFWMRRLMLSDCDQSQLPLDGARRRVGCGAGLKFTRRRISPSGVASAVELGRSAFCVVIETTAIGLTKLNRGSLPPADQAGALAMARLSSNGRCQRIEVMDSNPCNTPAGRRAIV